MNNSKINSLIKVSKNELNDELNLFKEECNDIKLSKTQFLYLSARFAGYLDYLQNKLWNNRTLSTEELEVYNTLSEVLLNLKQKNKTKLFRIYANSPDLAKKQFSFFKENIGNVFKINAFLGTSLKECEDKTEYTWELQTAKSSNSRSLTSEDLELPHYNSEEEIIFLASTNFKITKVLKKTVYLEETQEKPTCKIPTN